MVALSFVEGYVEGRNPWHHRKLGWKIKLPGGYIYPAYHFYLFVIILPLLITLPLIIVGGIGNCWYFTQRLYYRFSDRRFLLFYSESCCTVSGILL